MLAATAPECPVISKPCWLDAPRLPDVVASNDLDNLPPRLRSSGSNSSCSPSPRWTPQDSGGLQVKLPEVLCNVRPGASKSNGHRSRSPVMDTTLPSAQPPVRGRENQAFRRSRDCRIARCSPAHSPDSTISTIDLDCNESPGGRSQSSTTSCVAMRQITPPMLPTEFSMPSSLLARRNTSNGLPGNNLWVRTTLRQAPSETSTRELVSTERPSSCSEVGEQLHLEHTAQAAGGNAASPTITRSPSPPEETGASPSLTRSPAPPEQPRPPNASPPPCRWHRHLVKSLATAGQQSKAASVPARTITKLDGRKIYDLYYWEQAIQEDGDGGKVVVCRGKESEAMEFDLVMKIKAKTKLRNEAYLTSYRKVLMRMLNLEAHRNIVAIDEVLEDEQFFYVVMKRAKGGDLFAGLLSEFSDGIIPASVLRNLMTEILEALDHLHERGMLHRDIKPDNLVWAHDDAGTRRVMLIDFDHADPEFTDDVKRQPMVFGTRRFNAPETWHGLCTRQSDLYSVGVIFYLLMTGKMPYEDELFKQTCNPCEKRSPSKHRQMRMMDDAYKSLSRTEIDWSCEPWPGQPASLDFCQQLLAFSHSDRPCSARAALDHAWFSEEDAFDPAHGNTLE